MSKEHITIVGDGSTQADVEARVKQIKNLVAEVGASADMAVLDLQSLQFISCMPAFLLCRLMPNMRRRS